MKLKQIVPVLGIFVLVWACATKTGVAPESIRPGEGAEIFAKAEESFQTGLYEEALALYTDYVQRFGNDAMAE